MTSSMYRDLQQGHAVEADQIVGDLLVRGAAAGVKTPLIALAYASLSVYQNRETVPMIRVLLQTTIPPAEDDWSIARFSRLGALLQDQRDAEGRPVFEVTMRDRDPLGAPDRVLSTLDRSDFDEAWLFAVDVGDGLTIEDCEAIARFRRGGRGLLVTRDHMDLGSSVCGLGGVGKAHHFHSHNPDPDVSARAIDDPYTTYISWPNYHSGANGDFQTIEAVGPAHPLLAGPGRRRPAPSSEPSA